MSSLDAIGGPAQHRGGPEQRRGGPAASRARGQRSLRDTTMRLGIAAFAVYFWGVAVLMTVAPKVFFTHVGPFGVRNDHYIRDTATFNAALGAGLAVAYWRSSWRVPLLCCVTIQFSLHAVNHLLDIDKAHPHWLGPADFASLALSAVLLAGLARQAMRRAA